MQGRAEDDLSLEEEEEAALMISNLMDVYIKTLMSIMIVKMPMQQITSD